MYEAYAPIYDAIGQGRFSTRMAAWALAWLAEHGVRPARILDLACGTGEAALAFAATGYEVAGVDRSAAMLEIARGKARGAGYNIEYLHGDVRELPTKDERPKNQEPRTRCTRRCFSVLGSRFSVRSGHLLLRQHELFNR